MPVKLKSFTTGDYYRACGFSTKSFKAGVKGLELEYHHPTGIMLSRDGLSPEFVPIHNVRSITPENIEDLQKVLGESPEKSVENLKDSGFAVTLVDKENSTIVDGPIPKPKRKRRTKVEMEAARAAAS